MFLTLFAMFQLLVGWNSLYAGDRSTVIVTVGAPGEEEFGAPFARWAGNWQKAARQADALCYTVGLDSTNNVSAKDTLRDLLNREPKENAGDLWIVFIGHGTYDGKDAKFNLRGPDLTAAELTDWLKPFRRPVAVINSASSSAPFINSLSATGRVVVVSTKSGFEQNFSRFGQYLSESVADPKADLDKDGQVSLLEAFLTASRQVNEFYTVERRLATEHALLDDNGDGLGTPADWFRGIRAVKKAKENASLDGFRAHQFHLLRGEADRNLTPEQRQKRDALELEVANLREKKSQLNEDEYYRQLETLLRELAVFYP